MYGGTCSRWFPYRCSCRWPAWSSWLPWYCCGWNSFTWHGWRSVLMAWLIDLTLMSVSVSFFIWTFRPGFERFGLWSYSTAGSSCCFPGVSTCFICGFQSPYRPGCYWKSWTRGTQAIPGCRLLTKFIFKCSLYSLRFIASLWPGKVMTARRSC